MMRPEAAVAAVTNPLNVSNMVPIGSPSGANAVNEHMAISEIREVAGGGGDEARAAARAAIETVGGHIETRRHIRGIEAGRMRAPYNEVWWVPREAVRSGGEE